MYTKANNATNKNLELRDDLFCKYCGKQCKNLNSLKQHEIRCNKNPNKLNITKDKAPFYGHTPWNKGLTKATDERLLKASNTLKETLNERGGTFTGKHHTKETKLKMSLAQKKINHSDNNRNSYGKKGWYDGIFFMSTYELAYYIYMRDNFPQFKLERCKDRFEYIYNGDNHFYTPDFILNNQYIEIKGRETEKDLEKYKVVNNLQVLYYNDIYHMISYVIKHYKVKYLQDLYDRAG